MIRSAKSAHPRRRQQIRPQAFVASPWAAHAIVLPDALAQSIETAAAALSPEPTIRALLRRYRFDSLSYFVTRTVGGVIDAELMWTTLPEPWSALYRRDAFASVDPRLARARGQIGPRLWDARDYARDVRRREFLSEAARFGVCSGVAVALTDGAMNQVTVTFDRAESPASAARRAATLASVGDLTVTAIALHESVLKWRVGGGSNGSPIAPALTLRERDCLELAARGMTSADIGTKLCVAERTVNFHFSNIKTKLRAMNRPEAIARGIAMGLVTVD
jgi:DNA-binding CsgD family transcriptional regulator